MFDCPRLRSAIAPTLLAALFSAASALFAQGPTRAIDAIAPTAQVDRVAPRANFTPLTQLSRQLPDWVAGRPQDSSHAVDISTPLRVTFVLRRDPAAQAAFEQLLADQQNRNSPLFRQWLSPQQIGHLFGPTQNDLTSLTAWLTSQGLKIESISPSGVLVSVSGSAAVLGNALHTSFGMFDPNPNTLAAPRLSAVSEPSIPSALAPLVRSIHGLTQVPVYPAIHSRAVQRTGAVPSPTGSSEAQPLLTLSTGDHFLTPGDFAVIYDINSVYTAGNTGAKIGSKAQHVAVIGESEVTNTDITLFESATGLPSATPTVVIPTGALNPGVTGNAYQDEATLDVDRVYATAPGAIVDLVVAKDSTTEDGIFLAAQYNVNTLLDPVMSLSFGNCEINSGVGGVDFVDAFASAGAAEGITTLVSSGDSGAAGCDISFSKAPATQVAGINFICSSTYVTCVGGTEFNDTASPLTYWSKSNSSTLVSALSYIPEGAWNEPSTTTTANGVTTTTYAPAASGGGVSLYIAKPSWQKGVGVPADGFRDTPDVSFTSASHDGYFACLAYAGGTCPNSFEDFSGTSAAAPGMAGVVALVNTALGTAVGNINPQLYALAASTPAVFHDATIATSGVTGCTAATPSICNNSTPGPTTLTGGLAGFDLTTGFDLATGLGSIDVGQLVTAISSSATLTSTNLALTAAANPINAGASDTFTATITATSGETADPTGTVQFSVNGIASGAPVSVVAQSGDATATSASISFPTAGTFSITAAYTGDTVYASSSTTISLVVNAVATGSFTVTAAPVSITTTGGAIPAATTLIEVASVDSFSGTVALSCGITYTGTGTASKPPTCSLAVASVNVSSTLEPSVVLAVNTTAATTTACPAAASKAPTHASSWIGGSAGIVLAGLLLVLPFRKRRSLRVTALTLLVLAGIGSLSGCGSNGTAPVTCTPVTTPGTTSGPYTITVTGTSGAITKTVTIALTIS